MRFLLSAILFITIFSSSSYAQDSYCTVLGKCVDAGQRCDAEFYYANQTAFPQSRVLVECKTGYFCPSSSSVYEPVCVPLSGLGESCEDSKYQRCGSPYTCINFGSHSTCQITGYLAVGESCSNDFQCAEYSSNEDYNGVFCIQGKCGMQPRTQCSSDAQCPVGTYCNTDLEEWEANQCLPWLTTGDICQRDTQCDYSSVCVLDTETSNDYTCQPQFSKGENEYCERTRSISPQGNVRVECDVGLSCISNKCVADTAPNTGDTCTSDNDCDSNSFCQCGGDSAAQVSSPGKCSSQFLNEDKCLTTVQSLQKCATKNKCSLGVTFAPDSCIVRNCRAEFCSENCYNTAVISQHTCGGYSNPICNPPSSSSTLIPSLLFALIAIVVALFI